VLNRVHARFYCSPYALGAMSVGGNQKPRVRSEVYGATKFVRRELRTPQRGSRSARPSCCDDFHHVDTVGHEGLNRCGNTLFVRGKKTERSQMAIRGRNRSSGAVDSRTHQFASTNCITNSLDNFANAAEVTHGRDTRADQSSTSSTDTVH
jgi:hypothetical protein